MYPEYAILKLIIQNFFSHINITVKFMAVNSIYQTQIDRANEICIDECTKNTFCVFYFSHLEKCLRLVF